MAPAFTGSGKYLAVKIKGLLVNPYFLLILVALGFLARTRHYLAGLSYWYDEAFLLLPIYERSALDLIGPLPTQTIIPPLFLWLLRGVYVLGGPGELVMRSPAFVAGILGLGLMIPLGKRVLGYPGALWAAVLCALSHHALMHGSEVRPYTLDALATTMILLAASSYLAEETIWQGKWSWILLALAGLLPWLSFPSVLILATSSLALLLDCYQKKQRPAFFFWLLFSGILLGSVLFLWYIQARHLYYPGLKEHWRDGWDGFPKYQGAFEFLVWSVRRTLGVFDYANSGVGFLLFPLGIWGIYSLGKKSTTFMFLLMGPILVTYFASLVGKYPFSDRTIFFLAPCAWCLSVAGLVDLWQRCQGYWHSAIVIPMILILFLAGMQRTIRNAVVPMPRMEYREALLYVRANMKKEDRTLIWCRPLNEVYFGHVYQGCDIGRADENTPMYILENQVENHRFWVIAPKLVSKVILEPLQKFPHRETFRRSFFDVEVILFDPERNGASEKSRDESSYLH